MDRNELETYQVQLSQVELALVSDPSNAELTALRSELKELITLTETALEQAEAAAASASSSKPKAQDKPTTASVSFVAGDDILAKYSGDGKWYPARIISIGGSEDRRVYSVVFKGYNSTELVAAADVKPLPPSYAAKDSSSSASAAPSKKRKLTEEEEKEAAKKKIKNEKRMEVRAQKAAEQNSKQASWQKFAKKGEKKGIVIAGMQGKSIFQSPDNAHGKVGVTGSGKGMSDSVQRIKHKFNGAT